MRKIVLFAILAAGMIHTCSAADILLSGKGGATLSYLDYEFPTAINVTGRDICSYFYIGFGADANFNEYVGLRTGMTYEQKGATLKGNIISLINGDITYIYRYLQFPLHAKVSIPLLIPGNVIITAGPELGVNLGAERETRLGNNSSTINDDIDTLTESVDFGISGSVGYDFPIGKIFGMILECGYYYGFIDLYKDDDSPADQRIELYNRTVKIGLTLYANVASF
jgi:hypothetical protein